MSKSLYEEIEAILAAKGEGVEDPVPVEPEEEIIVVPKLSLEETAWEDRPDGKKMRFIPFSKKFGWTPTTVPDHLVVEFVGYDSEEPKALYIPPREQFEWFSFGVATGLKALFVGPTGCGKTLMAEHFAAATGRPCLRVDHTQELDKAQVFGTVHITEGDTDFVPGDLPLSAVAPTIVILDELSRAPGGANMIYKRMLDRGEIYMPEMKSVGAKAIKPDTYWTICATDNTKGDGEDLDKYPMSNVQDAAFRNVWDMLLEFDYLSVEEENQMILELSPKMPVTKAGQLANFSNLIHAGFKKGDISLAFSVRQIQAITSMFNAGIPVEKAIEMAYISFVSKSELSDVRETFRAVFGGPKKATK